MKIIESDLQARRSSLSADMATLCRRKSGAIYAIEGCDRFLVKAAEKIKGDADRYSYSDTMSPNADQEVIDHGEILYTSQYIPSEFLTPSFSSWELSEDENKVCNYMRHQLFLGLIAELDDFISQILLLILKAFPNRAPEIEIKLGDLTIKSLEKFQTPADLNSSLGISNSAQLLSKIDNKVENYIRSILYNSAFDQIKDIIRILDAEKDFLHSEWLQYSEMYSRRNSGIHNGWRLSSDYEQMVHKIKKIDARIQFPEPVSGFLVFDETYFSDCLSTVQEIVRKIKDHCTQFTKQVDATDTQEC